MAELNVQPKKKSPVIWILLVLVALALLFLLLRGCNDHNSPGYHGKDTIATTVKDWNKIDFNAPGSTYEEVTDKGIVIRKNKDYTIYTLGENILFATDQSELQHGAEVQLKQISGSLKRRFDGASLAVYGNTDATGTAEHNKQLGAARAKAVKNWLVENGEISADKITIYTKGESKPIASNATAKGKRLNRSVEIVALANKK